jgi:hypothetical protein
MSTIPLVSGRVGNDASRNGTHKTADELPGPRAHRVGSGHACLA